MPVKLYHITGSPYCMAIRVLAKYIGVELELSEIDMTAGEHLRAPYIELNPFHSVPTIDDSGFILYESRPILTYLVDKYAPGSDLYPKDLQQRAVVDVMLDVDLGTISGPQASRTGCLMNTGKDAPEDIHKKLKDSYTCLDNLLAKKKYVAGDKLTVADISLIHSLGYAEAHGDDFASYKNVSSYLKKVREALGEAYASNQKQMEDLKKWLNDIRK